MSRGSDSRRLPWLVFLAPFALAAAGLVAFLVIRDLPGGPGEPTPTPVPEFRFEMRDVEFEAVAADPSQSVLRRAAREVRSRLDQLYIAGFVDFTAWDEGRFPDALKAFGRETEDRAARDLEDLTLGDTARQISLLEPKEGTLDVRFLVDPDRRPYAAVARAYFRGVSDLGSGKRLRVEHRGRYLLRPFGARWLIVGYDVEGSQETLAAPTPGASPS